MSANPSTQLGPLTWVKPEIDFSLERTRRCLDDCPDAPDGTGGTISAALASMREVTGALQIIGMDALGHFSWEVEALLEAVAERTVLPPPLFKELLTRATNAIGRHLAALMAGAPENVMSLLPILRELAQARGGEPVDDQVLFRPDLEVCPPPHPAGVSLDGEALSSMVKLQRSRYQRGMLKWLRQSEEGLELMRDALQEIERAQPHPLNRTPWWVAAALVEGLLYGGLSSTDATKRLAGKIDRHLAAFALDARESTALVREILFHLTRCEPVSPLVRDVKSLYRLDSYVESSTIAGLPEVNTESIQAILHETQNALRIARSEWTRVSSGETETLFGFRNCVTRLESLCKELGNTPLGELVELMVRVADELGVHSLERRAAITMEMAAALIAAEQLLDSRASLTPKASARFDAIRDRLNGVLRGNPDSNQDLLIDEPWQQTVDRQLVSQVAQEMLANLKQIEQTLDAYFRNPSTPSSLKSLDALMRDVSGALTMLGIGSAAQLIDRCNAIVHELVEPNGPASEDETTLLAEGIGCVMLHIESLDRGYNDEPRAIETILARFDARRALVATASVPDFQTAGDESGSKRMTHLDFNVVAEAAEQSTPPPGFDVFSEQSNSEEVTQEEFAAILDQFDLSALKDEELNLHTSMGVEGSTLAQPPQSASAAAPTVAQPDVTSGQVLSVGVVTTAPSVDAEIVDIFIEEANEILAQMSDLTTRARVQPDDGGPLRSLRRGFHTLKGSGRMAGLHAIGDAAWTVESLLNAWLEAKRPASEALIKVIDTARTLLAGWIADVAHRGRTIVRTGELKILVTTAACELPTPNEPTSSNLTIACVTERVEVGPPDGSGQALSVGATPEIASIGQALLPAPLFRVFLEEAHQHVAILRKGLPVLASPASEDTLEGFTRAAHTLGGIARSAGFSDIGLVTGLIENLPLGTAERDNLLSVATSAVEAVEAMIESVTSCNMPLLPEAQRTRLVEEAAILRQTFAARATASGQPETVVTSAAESAPQDELREPAGESSMGFVPQTESTDPPMRDSAPFAGCQDSEGPSGRYSHDGACDDREGAANRGELRRETERRLMKDDIDAQLLPMFLDEVRDLVPLVGQDLRHLRDKPKDRDASDSLRRILHTIKGGARMVGAIRLGELVHVMEERLEAAVDSGAVTMDLLDVLEGEFDRLTRGLDALTREGAEHESAPSAARNGDGPSATVRERVALETSNERTPTSASQIRVAAETLDRLVNQTGEISISRGRIELEAQRFKQFVLELTDSVSRLRGQLREIEIHAEGRLQATLNQSVEHQPVFDPLEFDRYTRFQELTRLMAESLHDVTTVQQHLLDSLDEAQAALNSQSRLNRSLQDDLMRLQTVSFQILGERLYRLARQVSKETGKKAVIELVGAQTEVDRFVLDRIAAPLEHLVRNAITHGIEELNGRAQAEKPEVGALRLTLRRESNQLLISLSDDGRGIDHHGVRKKAVELGWITSDADPTRAEIEQFIFRPGLSTAAEVSELAGRGMGMDVVANEVRGLGGSLEITTEAGRGTTFLIRVPLTVAVAKVVLVTADDRRWAILSSLVEHVLEIPASKLSELWMKRQLDWMGQSHPLFYFPELIGEKATPAADRPKHFALVIRSSDQRVGVLVDQITVNHDLVLKKIGPQLAQLPGVTGATVLSDGEIVLILNPVALADSAPQQEVPGDEKPKDKTTSAPLVMVVDDSLTVRHVTGRLLSRNGYRVVTARDGLDALQQMEETTPDVLLADIEMPRMDGFDLTKNCKASPRTACIPIIMITSRLAPKHREYAQQLGVNVYMGKPYEEQELLAHIARFTASTAAA